MTVQTDHLKINQNKHVLEYYSVLKHSCKFKWFWVDDKINEYHPFKKEREASTCTFIMKRKFYLWPKIFKCSVSKTFPRFIGF